MNAIPIKFDLFIEHYLESSIYFKISDSWS